MKKTKDTAKKEEPAITENKEAEILPQTTLNCVLGTPHPAEIDTNFWEEA